MCSFSKHAIHLCNDKMLHLEETMLVYKAVVIKTILVPSLSDCLHTRLCGVKHCVVLTASLSPCQPSHGRKRQRCWPTDGPAMPTERQHQRETPHALKTSPNHKPAHREEKKSTDPASHGRTQGVSAVTTKQHHHI